MNSPSPSVAVDKSNARVQEMFGQIAPRYDLMNHLLSGGVDLYWRWYTVRTVPPQGTAPILDVCTGTGDLAFAYWNKGAGRVPVFATDFTAEMLTLAAQKQDVRRIPHAASDSGAAPVTFLQADTQQLPFSDNQFQIVSVAFGLRNVCDTRAGLREMVRVCQPGGRVAILEFSQPTLPVFGTLYAAYFRHVLPRLGQLFATNRQSAYHYLPESVTAFPCGAALATLLTEAGLERVTFTTLTLGIATLYVGVKATGRT